MEQQVDRTQKIVSFVGEAGTSGRTAREIARHLWIEDGRALSSTLTSMVSRCTLEFRRSNGHYFTPDNAPALVLGDLGRYSSAGRACRFLKQWGRLGATFEELDANLPLSHSTLDYLEKARLVSRHKERWYAKGYEPEDAGSTDAPPQEMVIEVPDNVNPALLLADTITRLIEKGQPLLIEVLPRHDTQPLRLIIRPALPELGTKLFYE